MNELSDILRRWKTVFKKIMYLKTKKIFYRILNNLHIKLYLWRWTYLLLLSNILGPWKHRLQKTRRQTHGHTVHSLHSSIQSPCGTFHFRFLTHAHISVKWLSKKEYPPKQARVQDLTKILGQFLPHHTRYVRAGAVSRSIFIVEFVWKQSQQNCRRISSNCTT